MEKRDYDCVAKIKSLRKEAKMSQVKFCEYFEIPKSTLENWERRVSSAPVYLVKLLEYKLIKEGLI